MDYFTLVISVVALIASIYGIYLSSKIAKQQIVTNKLEEAYEAIALLSYYYNSLVILQRYLEDSVSTEIFNAEQRYQNRIAYEKQVMKYKEHIDLKDLEYKCSRLEVIANAYMQEPLKIRVLAYSKFFWDLISISINGQWLIREMYYKKGFPDIMILNEMVENIQGDLIKRIQLGGKSIKQKDVRNYIENTLKSELGI